MISQKLNKSWTDIYYSLHYNYKEVLTHQNIRFLQIISKNEDVTIHFLSKVMALSHNTTSEHVQRLEKKGYVIKKRNAKDERQVIVSLTTKGQDALKQHTELDEEKINQIFESLTVDEQDKILDAFNTFGESAKKLFPDN
ncbi:MarR family transcriptional regulator [Bacillus cereus]|uniref:MarR family winged helix-turn-helix transcriptional regulator n=1 Tax=Bacillus cereus TaxID=1396 RepID=UPI000BF413EB|nr:MarR family transcriptional regulator [Bacillus cereus]PFL57230.1 MarR family transcriptional regulator [Bacillus cereus]